MLVIGAASLSAAAAFAKSASLNVTQLNKKQFGLNFELIRVLYGAQKKTNIQTTKQNKINKYTYTPSPVTLVPTTLHIQTYIQTNILRVAQFNKFMSKQSIDLSPSDRHFVDSAR